jgi:hypothetical protein
MREAADLRIHLVEQHAQTCHWSGVSASLDVGQLQVDRSQHLTRLVVKRVRDLLGALLEAFVQLTQGTRRLRRRRAVHSVTNNWQTDATPARVFAGLVECR